MLHLNADLAENFYKEVEELRKGKGDDSSSRLMMSLSILNHLDNPGIVQVFQEEGSGLVLELLLAVIGYNPAAKEFVRPIGEREFELLDNLRKGDQKDQRIFYALIYDREIAFNSVEIIKQTRGGLYLSDLLLISNVKDKDWLRQQRSHSRSLCKLYLFAESRNPEQKRKGEPSWTNLFDG